MTLLLGFLIFVFLELGLGSGSGCCSQCEGSMACGPYTREAVQNRSFTASFEFPIFSLLHSLHYSMHICI